MRINKSFKFIGQFAFKRQNFACVWVCDFQLLCVQVHAAKLLFGHFFIVLEVAVFFVTDDGVVDVLAVHADLVGAACVDFDAHGGVAVEHLVNVEPRVGGLAVGLDLDAALAAGGDIFVERGFDVGFFVGELADENGVVAFVHLAIANLFVQVHEGAAFFGEDEQA